MKLSIFSIMLIYFVYVLLFSNPLLMTQCSPLCHDHERISLLKFKQSFSIDESVSSDPFAYPKTQSWERETNDCCFWDGVECNNETRHIIGLDLTSSFLYGSIDSNSTLFELVHLQSLSLADNHFNFSRIPSSFEYLSNLTHLNLSWSVFSGQIPFGVSKLSKLSSLSLFGNVGPDNNENLLQLKTPDLKTMIQNMTSLEILHLSNVDISSIVPPSLTNFTSLRSLILMNCGLRGEFPALVFKLPNLQLLSVPFNRFLSGKWPSLNHSSSLQVLRLAGTDFSGEIPWSIEQRDSLTILDVGDCKFSGSIPWSLGKLSRLTYLDLSNNRLRGQIPSSFRNFTQLEYLSLSNNDFSNGTVSWVGNLTKLVSLRLRNSSLIGPIPRSFSYLISLESIRLDDNYLSGKVDFDIFLSLKNLSVLSLSGNSLEVITKPSTNRTLPQFTALDLWQCGLKTFPDFLRYQQRMELLNLGENQIGGQIPKWVLNISVESLGFIHLGNNFLTGFEESPVLFPWINLLALNLEHNMLNCTLPVPPKSTVFYSISYSNLTGKVPPSLCDAHSLVLLKLSNNELDGELPPCLGSFSHSLSYLYLNDNSFSGEIPQKFLQSNNLIAIDLGNNKFQGRLPRSLANCTTLEYLGVGNNQLNDVFPFWLGKLPELRVLVLRNNTFHGNIGDPPTNFEFPNLRIIDVSYNSLTGKLPSKYIESWKAMEDSSLWSSGYMHSATQTTYNKNNLYLGYIYGVTITIKGIGRLYEKIQNALAAVDFSNNKFNGRIPEALGKLKGLHSLDLSNNNLTGGIPSSLGNLSELESLDISRNMLAGPIPQELTNLHFLQYFNVSHNQLVGPIPQENQLSRFDSSSYEGNSGLCGIPLPKCGKHHEDSAEPSSTGSEEEEEDWLDFGWRVVAIGYACGFVVGVLLGKLVLSRRPRWFSVIYRVRI